MNGDNTELYSSATTNLDAVRCKKCGGIDFEYTSTRVFCIRCGLVAKKTFYSSASTAVDLLIEGGR